MRARRSAVLMESIAVIVHDVSGAVCGDDEGQGKATERGASRASCRLSRPDRRHSLLSRGTSCKPWWTE